MKRIISLGALSAVLLTSCAAAEHSYIVSRIGHDPETGRYYIVCQSPDGKTEVEITKSEEQSRRWRVYAACYDYEVEAALPGRPVQPLTTTASTPVSLTPTTSS